MRGLKSVGDLGWESWPAGIDRAWTLGSLVLPAANCVLHGALCSPTSWIHAALIHIVQRGAQKLRVSLSSR